MPIFDDIISPSLGLAGRSALAFEARERPDGRFRACFPDMHYDIYWETRLMNAQAYIGKKGRCVRLYGGLGRHRRGRR